MREDVLNIGAIAWTDVELGQPDAPLAVCAEDVHRGVERGQRHAEVEGVQGDAVLARAEDRVHPRHTSDGGTARPGRALVARGHRRVANHCKAETIDEFFVDDGSSVLVKTRS